MRLPCLVQMVESVMREEICQLCGFGYNEKDQCKCNPMEDEWEDLFGER